MKTKLVRDDCPFTLPDRQPGQCNRCGKKLVGRQRRWCGSECEMLWWRNHQWGFASAAALKRDKRTCRRCGVTEDQLYERAKAEGNGRVTDAAWRRLQLEVNHVTPVLGLHGSKGCHHHLENLETLCHPCHQVTTREQRAAGALTRKVAS